jgi:F-type H+-transporting ATPase subunit b
MLINEKIFILVAEAERGGLFDIGPTLPLVAIQFLILMFILNIILYKPLIKLVNERNETILKNLSKSSEILLAVSNMSNKYENGLKLIKKETKQNIEELKTIQKEKFEKELSDSQKSLDIIVEKILDNFNFKKQNTLENINIEVTSLATQIIKSLE